MKIAILSDAHGNLIYFQKCMKKMQEYSPEKIVFFGRLLWIHVRR